MANKVVYNEGIGAPPLPLDSTHWPWWRRRWWAWRWRWADIV